MNPFVFSIGITPTHISIAAKPTFRRCYSLKIDLLAKALDQTYEKIGAAGLRASSITVSDQKFGQKV